MAKLSDHEIEEALGRLPGWTLESSAIRKEFRFPRYRAAIEFIVRIADVAEAARHHPDLENHYNRVVVSLSTHDEGGVTEKDVALAATIEAAAEPAG